ncbi:3-oxoacyl-[acyl-carrier-protein] reductase [Formivibrio citricus]|uniref:3-oxoacyl-[acyl-carrier-protein] reductase n=1 Tax=Formivibrio citricus TaxID=83765 RepID=A0A1I4ZUI9_9NEIS|nr:3-oxoacyl-ACP reductase FabG [Formivibrio citricus]SFN53649.1 3-oxoacyl-[acyl-carrier-protein] reductase [Formivibrio citricus]
MSLQGKIALVTGASRGIGQAIALELAGMGVTVIGTATSDSGAEAITAYLKEAGNAGRGMRLEVTEEGACDGIVETITKEFGGIDILVNNAGITRDNLLMRMKDEEWDALFATNLRPIYKLSKAVMRGMMKSRWGRIINITSVVGAIGNAGQTNYSAAKAAMFGFTKSLAKEVGSRGVTVNAVAPGFIDTDMTKGLPEEQKAKLVENIALGRLGLPQDIADAVGFLASDKAGYITGCTLHVNGGMFMN